MLSLRNNEAQLDCVSSVVILVGLTLISPLFTRSSSALPYHLINNNNIETAAVAGGRDEMGSESLIPYQLYTR